MVVVFNLVNYGALYQQMNIFVTSGFTPWFFDVFRMANNMDKELINLQFLVVINLLILEVKKMIIRMIVEIAKFANYFFNVLENEQFL